MQEIKTTSKYRQTLRERILDTAMAAFAERGVKAVKMDDIANTLSISKRTLYEIYGDKEALLFEGIKKFQVLNHQEMEEVASRCETVMEIVLNMYRMKVEEFSRVNPLFYIDIGKYPRIVAYINKDSDEKRQRFLLFIKRGVSEGYFRDDVNYDLVALMFDALGHYMMESELYRKFSFEDILTNILFVTLRGFCTQKGIEVLDHFMDKK